VARPDPEAIEQDPRFAKILDAGHGIPSSDSELGSRAIADMIDWWRRCYAGGEQLGNMLDDVDQLVCILNKFKAAVAKDHSLVIDDSPLRRHAALGPNDG